MHDPETQAFVIPYGWRTERFKNGTKWRYWKPFITIWHVDPERNGSDDSCGWFRPPLNKKHLEIIKALANDEARHPWFQSLSAKENTNPVECEAYVRGAFVLVAQCMKNRGCLRREVTFEQASRWASLMVHNAVDNFRSSLAFKSGYHSNWYRDPEPNTEKEDEFFRERQAHGFFSAIMGYILREQRHWWEHPKWHVIHWKRFRDYNRTLPGTDELTDWREKHPYKYFCLPVPVVGWRLQIHFLQSFKRWAFSRCSKCGKGFKWGYAPTTNSWNGTGPLWCRSEKDVFHRDCDLPADDSAKYAGESDSLKQK